MTKTQTTASKTITDRNGSGNCLCGCGELVLTMGRSLYKPGHDARHAGNLGRLVAETGDDSLLAQLPTPALRAKAETVANNARAKAQAKADREAARAAKKAAKAEAPQVADDDDDEDLLPISEIKVGRWTYPVRRDPADREQLQRNERRDGSGNWIAL
ncbi:hypothetical protein [Pseudarthrobacter scleromae]|uniref:hypothetical protein n=1 Tax=Pseudarthrobacter scleromae TaxID=158897 RepID=UPI003D058F5A